MISSSMVSREVSAVNPSSLCAFVTSGYGGSLTYLKSSSPRILRQIRRESSKTVVDVAVERLKSSLVAASCSRVSAIPRQIAAVSVMANLLPASENPQWSPAPLEPSVPDPEPRDSWRVGHYRTGLLYRT